MGKVVVYIMYLLGSALIINNSIDCYNAKRYFLFGLNVATLVAFVAYSVDFILNT